jgi:transcriptional regulator with XRE-family HTH domain
MSNKVASNRPTADPFLSAFGSHLRALRKNSGLSQEETADRAGINVTYLSGVERGLRNPSIKNVRRLADTLGVPTKELFDFGEASLSKVG